MQSTAKNQPVCFAESKITTSMVTTNAPTRTTSTGSLIHAVQSEFDKASKTTTTKLKKSGAKRDRFSPLGDISDTQSETSYHLKSKTLPRVPKNEVPVTMSTLKKLVRKDPLSKSILQRPSSSLDFTENDELLKQTMLNSILNSTNKSLNRLSLNKSLNHLSPYSSLSDIANLINQSSAVTLGRLSPAIMASTHLSKLGAINDLKQQQNPLIKTVKQQLKEELRTAINERKRLLELRNRSDLSKNDKLALAFGATNQPINSLASSLIKGRSETDLRGLTSTYIDPNITTDVSNILNTQNLKNRLLESAEDRVGREQRAARIKAEIERRKMSRNKNTRKKLHLPSTSREMLNTLKNEDYMTSSGLSNERNIEKELMKEVQLANIEQLEQDILENEMINEELVNQDLMDQHLKNLKILGCNPFDPFNNFDNFTGSYMPSVSRRPPRTAADDYFGTRRQKILARQQQINRTPGDYALDDLYIHQYPRYYGNQFVHNVQTGGLSLNRNRNRRHISNCLNTLSHNYPHRSHLAYGDQTSFQSINEFPSRSRKLVENLTSANPDIIALQNLHSLPVTMPVIQTATSSNLFDASNLNQRLIPTTRPKYPFPIKRVFLTRESKERTAMNNGNPFGIQLVGGQLIPSTNMLGTFVVKIQPGSMISTLGELREGDQVLEWEGIPLTGLRNNEVQQIMINSFGLEEIEITIKDDRPMGGYWTISQNPMDHNLQMQHAQQQMLNSQMMAPQISTVPIATQLITMPQLVPATQMTLNTVLPTNQQPNPIFAQPNSLSNIRPQFTTQMVQQPAFVQQAGQQITNLPSQHTQAMIQPASVQQIGVPQQIFSTSQMMPGQVHSIQQIAPNVLRY